MKNAISLLVLTMTASAAINANRFVTPAAALAGAGVNAQGVSDTDAAIGDKLAVHVLGTAIVEAGAAIAAGALIETDATGRAITKNAGVTVARLAPGEVATAAGQFIEVVLIPN
ncbi:MAG: DUF2190 family protein [Gallionellaceae bacterium]|nr:DUF2190 family protein [Gallionellaceae bacterium]